MKGQAQRIVLSSARKFINMGALSRLWNLFKKLHSADIASILNHLTNRERLIIFNVLYEKDQEKAAEVLSELDPEDAAQILKELPIKQIS
ncbi:MAG TPA: magnesium transporter, partial [Candidatus Aminicenantes bacterium]|nr:magnesium transporter [Candidatus Aminicenantes bacterium]